MEFLLRAFACIGIVTVLAGVVMLVIVVAHWVRPQPACTCLEIMGDDPDCPQHAALAALLQRDPGQPTHFERELEQRLQGWGTRPHA